MKLGAVRFLEDLDGAVVGVRLLNEDGFYDVDIFEWDASDKFEEVMIDDALYYKTSKDDEQYFYRQGTFKVKKFPFYELVSNDGKGKFVVSKKRYDMKVLSKKVNLFILESEELVIDFSTGQVLHKASETEEYNVIEFLEKIPSRVYGHYNSIIRNFFGKNKYMGDIFLLLKNLMPENEVYFLEAIFRSRGDHSDSPSRGFLEFVRRFKNIDYEKLMRLGVSDIESPQRFILLSGYNDANAYPEAVSNHNYFYKFAEQLNLEETKLHKILGCPKFFLPYAKRNFVDHHIIKNVSKLTDMISGNLVKELIEIAKDEFSVRIFCINLSMFIDLIETYGYTNPKNLILYLGRDLKMRQGITSYQAGLVTLRDYNRMAKEMNQTPQRYPKSLKKDHDIMMMNYKVVISKEKAENFSNVVNEKAYLSLKSVIKEQFYSVITPESIHDLVAEGNDLSHCIASYANSVISGKCKIVFLRHTENIKEPLISIEVRGDNVRQISGFANRPPNRYEMEYIKGWAKEKGLSVKKY
ncbi:MAG: PcfJ domain-containing protein [Gammaproteobacteria bacterium]